MNWDIGCSYESIIVRRLSHALQSSHMRERERGKRGREERRRRKETKERGKKKGKERGRKNANDEILKNITKSKNSLPSPPPSPVTLYKTPP